MAWNEFFEYQEVQQHSRKLREREEAWERWQRFEKGRNEWKACERPEKCPDCGSDRILPIAYGLPAPETEEAARRGKVVLGGCMVQEPSWHCQQCFNSWPEDSEPRQLIGTPEWQEKYLMEMAVEWASIEIDAMHPPSTDEPAVINYWDREDGRRVFLLKTISGETIRTQKLLYLQPYGGPPVYEITHGSFFDRRQIHLAAVAARRLERRLTLCTLEAVGEG
jgi:hypothetical protein